MNNAARFSFQELLLSSSSSDEEYEEIDEGRVRGPQARPRIADYVISVVSRYDDEEFRENFRMRRMTFDYILTLVCPALEARNTVGRHPVQPRAQLLFTLWYFSTPDCYRSICGRFNIAKATALRTVRRVTNVLLGLSTDMIQWPSGNYIETVQNVFDRMGFPNTIGCVDGSFVQIPMPKNNGLSYISRNNFPALIIQGVCDHRMLFTNCYAGEVGSTHDANVLKRSELSTYLFNERLEKFPNNTHCVGDKAYHCLPTLMVPFKDNGHLHHDQTHFNFLLSRVRSIIERTFALLKKRFRCLNFFDIQDIQWACKYIMACCILHNICILQNDILQIEQNDENDDQEFAGQQFDRQFLREGILKRHNLCQILRNLEV